VSTDGALPPSCPSAFSLHRKLTRPSPPVTPVLSPCMPSCRPPAALLPPSCRRPPAALLPPSCRPASLPLAMCTHMQGGRWRSAATTIRWSIKTGGTARCGISCGKPSTGSLGARALGMPCSHRYAMLQLCCSYVAGRGLWACHAHIGMLCCSYVAAMLQLCCRARALGMPCSHRYAMLQLCCRARALGMPCSHRCRHT